MKRTSSFLSCVLGLPAFRGMDVWQLIDACASVSVTDLKEEARAMSEGKEERKAVCDAIQALAEEHGETGQGSESLVPAKEARE